MRIYFDERDEQQLLQDRCRDPGAITANGSVPKAVNFKPTIRMGEFPVRMDKDGDEKLLPHCGGDNEHLSSGKRSNVNQSTAQPFVKQQLSIREEESKKLSLQIHW